MNLGVKIGIGIGAAALLGVGIYFATKKKAKPTLQALPITPTTPIPSTQMAPPPPKKKTNAGKFLSGLLDSAKDVGVNYANQQLNKPQKAADGVSFGADGATWN